MSAIDSRLDRITNGLDAIRKQLDRLRADECSRALSGVPDATVRAIADAAPGCDPDLRAMLVAALADPADMTRLGALADWIQERRKVPEPVPPTPVPDLPNFGDRHRWVADHIREAVESRLRAMRWPRPGDGRQRVRSFLLYELSWRVWPMHERYGEVPAGADIAPKLTAVRDADIGMLLDRLYRASRPGTARRAYTAAVMAANGFPGPVDAPDTSRPA